MIEKNTGIFCMEGKRKREKDKRKEQEKIMVQEGRKKEELRKGNKE